MRKQRNWPIEEKEGWSARLVDGQWSPTSSINGLMVQPIGRWSTRESTDGEKKAGIKEIHQKEKQGGGGSIHDWQQVKS
jgi:hypothetical protein